MGLYSYVVEHDVGFAPNPFHGVCTLACCKPDIRRKAQPGDIVLGTGSAKHHVAGRLVYWMRVDEVLTFDQYWQDVRFRRKKPRMFATAHLRYGDNIYCQRDGASGFQQVDSFHSMEDGSTSLGNLKRDTGKTDRVLIGNDFAYWGRSCISVPEELMFAVKKGAGHKCHFTEDEIAAVTSWLGTHSQRGYLDEPVDWEFLAKRAKRKRKA